MMPGDGYALGMAIIGLAIAYFINQRIRNFKDDCVPVMLFAVTWFSLMAGGSILVDYFFAT